MELNVKSMVGLLVLGLALDAAAQVQPPPAKERGLGPFTIRTKDNTVTARILRRDRGTLWVSQARVGGTFEVGIPVGDVVQLEMPAPRFFEQARQASSPEQIAQAQAGLKSLFELVKPYRDIPGVVADEAILLQGLLAERQGKNSDALTCYEDILKQPYASSQQNQARLKAGLCYTKTDQWEKALESLNTVQVSDDDVDLLSEAKLAQGQAYAKLGRPQDALSAYLYLVVFYPYIQSNEVRCLDAALPCYAELKDWEALFKTIQVIKSTYPGSLQAQDAADFAETYAEHLKQEEAFQEPNNHEGADEK